MRAHLSCSWIVRAAFLELLLVTACADNGDDTADARSDAADASIDQRPPDMVGSSDQGVGTGGSPGAGGTAGSDGMGGADGEVDGAAEIDSAEGESGGELDSASEVDAPGAEADGAPEAPGMGGAGADAAVDVAMDVSDTIAEDSLPDLVDLPPDSPPGPMSGVAIISSDATTSALSLAALGATAVTWDQCLHSGSVSPKLSIPWSNQLRLASGVQADHEIGIIDQKNGTITRVAGPTCEVIQQASVGSGFDARPFDLVGGLPAGKLYVTRSFTNPANASEGGDILVLDATTGAVRGRIDLRGQVPAGGPTVNPWQPFPKGALLLGGKVYVVVANKNVDDTSFGESRLAVIDPNTDTISASLALNKRNCGAIQRFFGAATASRLVIACTGVPRPLSGATNHYEHSGFGDIDASTTPPTLINDRVAGWWTAPTVSNTDVAATSGPSAYNGPVYLGLILHPTALLTTTSETVSYYPLAPPMSAGNSSGVVYGDYYARISMRLDPVQGRLYVADRDPQRPRVSIIDLTNPRTLRADYPNYLANPAGGRLPQQVGFY